MAICFHDDGIHAVFVRHAPAASPCVELAVFYPANASTRDQALAKLAKELHADRHHCTTLLGAGEYQILSIEAPPVPPDELKTAIRWRLKDMLDYRVEDATIDVLDIPVEKNATARAHSMYAVAARNQVIEKRQALFDDAKIPLSVIDIPEMAQRNISALLESEGRGLAMLSFDSDGGLLTITFAGELYLCRRIDVTLAQLAQADAVRREECYDRITLELQRSLDHFDRQYHFITVSKLMLSPLGTAIAGLREYLATNIHLPVEALDLASVCDLSRAPELRSAEAQQRYFLTIGAAMRHEEKAL